MTDTAHFDVPCLTCGRPIGDHTVREAAECHPTSDPATGLNTEFAVTPGGIQWKAREELGAAYMAGAVKYTAMVAETAFGAIPMLEFRFVQPDGIATYPAIRLGLTPSAMRNLKVGLGKAMDAVCRAADEQNKNRRR